jgi:GAF domain-containing protein
MLGMPLLRDGVVIGVIALSGGPRFDEAEIELVKPFAAQAVIAMENARLITNGPCPVTLSAPELEPAALSRKQQLRHIL